MVAKKRLKKKTMPTSVTEWGLKKKMGEVKENKRLRAKLRCSAPGLQGNGMGPFNSDAEHLSFALGLLFS